MRLVNYGAGEIADRLTILALKLAHAPESGGDHFRHEQVALLAKLRAGNGIASYLDELLELGAVNGQLWQAEDELRGYRDDGAPETQDCKQVAYCAYRIQQLNDRRAALVEAINLKTGEHRGSEKL
jgi:hypothetical protein